MSTSTSTNPAPAVTMKQAPPPTLRQQLESPKFHAQIAKALPKHLTPDRQIRVAVTAITRTPKLADCDQASFFGALLTLSQFGLEPDGRRAHLIPFENRKRNCVECQLIIDWKGLAELAMRSGLVVNLHADVVRDGDLFAYSAGKIARHVPHFLRRDSDRPERAGEIYAVYAMAEFRDGSTKAEVMSMDEVEGIRKRSRAANNGPWVTDYNEMAKKTAFRRLSKWLPLSAEFRDAVAAEDDFDPINEAVDVTPPAMRIGKAKPEPEQVAVAESDDVPMNFAAEPSEPASSATNVKKPHERLADAIDAAGYNWPEFIRCQTVVVWLDGQEGRPQIDTITGYGDIPDAIVEKLLGPNGKATGLIAQLARQRVMDESENAPSSRPPR